MSRTFGPGLLPPVGNVAGIGIFVLGILGLPHSPNLEGAVYAMLFALFGIVMLVVSARWWCWYHVDDDGIRRTGVCRSLRYAWGEIGGIPARTIHGKNTGETAIVSVVVDQEWRTLFRIGPWVRRRTELVRRIREEVRVRQRLVRELQQEFRASRKRADG